MKEAIQKNLNELNYTFVSKVSETQSIYLDSQKQKCIISVLFADGDYRVYKEQLLFKISK